MNWLDSPHGGIAFFCFAVAVGILWMVGAFLVALSL
jgi:hypothetical protein